MSRTILHVDLNNFYASAECLYRPEIRDKPVIVCAIYYSVQRCSMMLDPQLTGFNPKDDHVIHPVSYFK